MRLRLATHIRASLLFVATSCALPLWLVLARIDPSAYHWAGVGVTAALWLASVVRFVLTWRRHLRRS